jgi:hypothetical protein
VASIAFQHVVSLDKLQWSIVMAAVDAATLWQIFQCIGATWGTTSACDMNQAQFTDVVNWQAQRDPAYATYYTAAVAELSRLETMFPPGEALSILLSENQLPNPNLPDVANYVLLEFMRWNVAFGGFQLFNYANYAGWMGGGSFLTLPPPYRTLP